MAHVTGPAGPSHSTPSGDPQPTLLPAANHHGRHRAPLRVVPALLGSAAVLIVSLGTGALLLRPHAPTADSSLPYPASPAPQPADAAAVPSAGSAAVVGLMAGATAAPSPRPVAPTPRDRITRLEDDVTVLVNKERAKAGCRSVRTDERMRTAARRHSADMARNNYFSHTGLNGSTFVDRLAAAAYPAAKASGENIAYGYADAAAVMKGWMNSPGHKRNILDCRARTTGLGLAFRNRTAYWTQEFGTAA